MQRYENVGIHLENICEGAIVEFRRDDLQETGPPKGVTDLETVAGFELEGTRRNEVLRRKPRGNGLAPTEAEVLRRADVEDAVQEP